MLSLIQENTFSQLETMGAATEASLSLTGTVCDLNVGVSTFPLSLDLSLLLVRWAEVLRQNFSRRHLHSYGILGLGLGLLCLDLRRQKDSSPVSPCQFLFNRSAWCWCSL